MRGYLREVAAWLYYEFIVGPKGVVESEVTVFFFGFIWVEETGHVAGHVDAESAVERSLSLVERSDSNSNFNTHSNN